MSLGRTMVAALVGGVVMWLVSFVLHGIVMGSAYMKYPEVFVQGEGNPFPFLLLEVLIAFPAAMIFAKTRQSWAGGIAGGLSYGFWLGLVGSFAQLFNPLVMEGFPYYMGWCWWGINMITTLSLGATLAMLIKRT